MYGNIFFLLNVGCIFVSQWTKANFLSGNEFTGTKLMYFHVHGEYDTWNMYFWYRSLSVHRLFLWYLTSFPRKLTSSVFS